MSRSRDVTKKTCGTEGLMVNNFMEEEEEEDGDKKNQTQYSCAVDVNGSTVTI